MTEKQRIIEFIEGRKNGREFIYELLTDDGLLDWIQTNMPLKRCSQKKPSYLNGQNHFECVDSVPFDIRIELENKIGISDTPSLGEIIDVHVLLHCCFTENFPSEEIHVNTSLEDTFDFILANTPACIGGNGVDVILEEIYDSTAGCETKSERIRSFRSICRDRFHIEGRRYPRCVQCAQWPLDSNGEPMIFLRQRTNSDEECDFVNYYFLDSVSNTEVVVNQSI